jgi:hypothetical protein
MLVTFTCPVYADITMFGDVALELLRLMGHSGAVPGALDKEEVGPALQRLEAALDVRAVSQQEAESSADDEEGETVVGLARRAWPLIQLLRAAARAESYVMWDSRR